MSSTTNLKHVGLVSGPQTKFCWLRFVLVDGANPTVEESHGFSATVVRTSDSVTTATLANTAIKSGIVFASVEKDTAGDWYEVTPVLNTSTGVVTITTRYTAASDTAHVAADADGSETAGTTIQVLCLVREAS